MSEVSRLRYSEVQAQAGTRPAAHPAFGGLGHLFGSKFSGFRTAYRSDRAIGATTAPVSTGGLELTPAELGLQLALGFELAQVVQAVSKRQ